MSESRTFTNTFVLRFYMEGSLSGGRWRGSIEHIPSGERTEFLRVTELVRYWRRFGVVLDATDGNQPKMENNV